MRDVVPLPPIYTRPSPPQPFVVSSETGRPTTPRGSRTHRKSIEILNQDLFRPSFPINDNELYESMINKDFSKRPNPDNPTFKNKLTELRLKQKQVNKSLCQSKKKTPSASFSQTSPPIHPEKQPNCPSSYYRSTPTNFSVVSEEKQDNSNPTSCPKTPSRPPLVYRGSPPNKPHAHAGRHPSMPSPPFRALSSRSSHISSPSFHGRPSKARHVDASSSHQAPHTPHHYAPTYVISPEGSRVHRRSHVPRNNIRHLISPNGSRTELVTPSGSKTWVLRPNGSNTFIDGRSKSGPRQMSQDFCRGSPKLPSRHFSCGRHRDINFGSELFPNASTRSLSNTSQTSNVDSISYQHLHNGFKSKEIDIKRKLSKLPKAKKVRTVKPIPKWESSNKIHKLVSSRRSLSAQRVAVSYGALSK